MKRVFLFTNSFPFAKIGETFIEDEMLVASQIDNLHITIVPINFVNYKRELPFNVNVDVRLAKSSFLRRIFCFFSVIFSKWTFNLFIQGADSPKNLKEFKLAIKYMYGSQLVMRYLTSNVDLFKPDTILYSYWFNHTPLGFARAIATEPKLKGLKLYTRAHRFDVYERGVGAYIPYRKIALNYLDKVFVVSEDGANFLRDKYKEYVEKINVSRLGVMPSTKVNLSEQSPWDVTLISCSAVTSIKRVSLIFSSALSFAIENSSIKIQWTHFGGGPLFEELKVMVSSNKCLNFKVDLKGIVPKNEIIEHYKNINKAIFVNLSETEGVPVSIMEAISSGFPVIATNAGGNSEIVTNETGCLLPVMFDQAAFSKALLYIVENYKSFDTSINSFYNTNYNASKTYRGFYTNL